MTLRALLTACLLMLAACAGGGRAPDVARQTVGLPEDLPPMKIFGDVAAQPAARANADIARDFMDLSFRLESGREIDAFSRFEGPVGVALLGPVPATARGDLDRLLARLRDEAGISITPARPENAAITITFLPRKVMQRQVPKAACFVAPRVAGWEDYLRASRAVLDWTTVGRRERAAIFIPDDTSPQEIRDCLNEELAQALGPLNDLYRLPDSIFNDDNIHSVLTGFDMLILRLTYAPDLQSGMTRGQVAAALPGLLDRMNPRGRGIAPAYPGETPRAYVDAIETALGPGAGEGRRRDAALKAVTIAKAEGWRDARAGFAWLALGRLTLTRDPVGALAAFEEADRIYRADPLLAPHTAHADVQIAAIALATGQADLALALATRAAPEAAAVQNAALLASLLMIRAEALSALGRVEEAQVVRLDSIGWARYGFGSDAEIRDRLAGIARLAAMNRPRG
ncbi:MAG: DUF2927 domain-containing protein [Rhodobacteraceae bacterium]|nr:DUF2927 domain-containing protein [Paracoccaceae bacterium]